MLSAFALLFALQSTASPEPMPTPQILPAITVRAPKAELRLQVAKTPQERERGLMSVTHLPAHTGMLFVFERDAKVAFWMKDTLVPLDMIFLSADGMVRRVFANVPVVAPSLPDSRIPLEEALAKFVIELPAREAAKDGLRPGVRLHLSL